MKKALRLSVALRDQGVCSKCKTNTLDMGKRLLDVAENYRWLLEETWAGMKSLGFDRHLSLAEIDHILPVDEGGRDELDNLQTLCRPCHKAKTKEQSHRRGRLNKLIGKKQRKTIAHLTRLGK